MSFELTPHWAWPTLFVMLAGLGAALLGGGCVADVQGLQDPAAPVAELCGGSVCFTPSDVAVKHWGDGEVTVVAWRADDLGCVPPQVGDAPRPGTAIELTLHRAHPGARIDVVPPPAPTTSDDPGTAAERDVSWVSARALRVANGDHGKSRHLADETTVSGQATILDLDAPTGRVRVRMRAQWSSGVTSETLLDVDGPHACAR